MEVKKIKIISASVILGILCILANVLAFVYDGSWIDRAISLDVFVIGAVIGYLFGDDNGS